MRRTGLLFSLVTVVAAATAHAQGATVMASISYPDLPARSRTVVLELTLEDVTTPGQPSVVASARIPRPETSPMMVSLNYDAAVIVAANRYVVRATVVDAGVTLFSSRAPVRVLTGGHGSLASLALTTPAESAPAEPAPAPAPAPVTIPAPKTAPPQSQPAPIQHSAPPAPRAPRVTVPRGSMSALLAGPKLMLARTPVPPDPRKASPAPKSTPPTASKPPAANSATKSAPSKPQPAPAKSASEAPKPTSAPAKPAADAPKPTPAPVKPTVEAPKPAPAPAKPITEGPKPVPTPVKPTAEAPESAPPVAPVVTAGRPAEPLVDLPATFTGAMPCADCAAIQYELTLAPDASYSLKKTFQGGGDRVQMEAGSWDYSSDRVVLVLKSSHDAWSWFAVRPDGVLRAVDSRGESIGRRTPADLVRGNVVASTVTKASSAAFSAPVTVDLSDALWTLTELENKPVRPATDRQRAIVMGFDARARVFSGASGCNVLEGGFSATWRALTLSPSAPLRVCRIDQSTERALSRAIKATRSYRITGTTMDWFDEKGTRIARFEGQRRD